MMTLDEDRAPADQSMLQVQNTTRKRLSRLRIPASARRAQHGGVVVLRWLMSHAPVTASIIAVMTISTAAVRLFTSPHFATRHLALGARSLQNGHWWNLVTSAVVAPTVISYLVSIALLLACAVPLERRMGAARFVLAVVVVHLAGSIAGIGLALLAAEADGPWSEVLTASTIFAPVAWVAGVAMTASAVMPVLWRRRVRVGAAAVAIVLTLFVGGFSDLVILASITVGLVLGRVLYGKPESGGAVVGTRREQRVLVALVVVASALGPVLSILYSDAAGPLEAMESLLRSAPWTADDVRAVCSDAPGSADCKQGLFALQFGGLGFTVLAMMPSLFLVAVSDGLRRGRRSAWRLALIVQGCLTAITVLNLTQWYSWWTELSQEGAMLDASYVVRSVAPLVVPIAVAAVLVVNRRAFDVRVAEGEAWKAWRSIGAVGLALGAVYVGAGVLTSVSTASVPSLIVDFVQRLVPTVYLEWFEPSLQAQESVPPGLFDWVGVVFWIAAAAVVTVMFVRPNYQDDAGDAQRARHILRTSGGSNLAWMSTWRRNHYWFAPDNRSFVAYRVIGGVALTTGGPVGPDAASAATVRGFAEFSADNGWTPCLYSTSNDVRIITDDLGWSAVHVGEEAIIDLAELKFTGKKFQDVRTALNRATKGGITAEWITYSEAPIVIRDQISAISREWVADKAMPEMGFTLGGLTEMEDPEVKTLVAIDADRTIHGVTSWLPVYRDGQLCGWTLDFMRRRTAGFGPTIEFLIASAALSFQADGVRLLSLSGAPLATAHSVRSATSAPETGSGLDRVLDTVGRTLEPVYGFRSLLAFKSKFQPRYESMYMCFPDSAALPSIANAISRAYLPSLSFTDSARLVRSLASPRPPRRTSAQS